MKTTEKSFDIIGVGFVCLDHLNIIDGLPEWESVVRTQEYTEDAGGPVATAIATAATLGAKVSFMGKTGNDEPAQFLLRSLQKKGVDVQRLKMTNDAQTAHCCVLVKRDGGKRCFVFTPGDSLNISVNNADLRFLSQGRYVHMDGALCGNDALRIARYARQNDIHVSLDASFPHTHTRELISMTQTLIVPKSFAERFLLIRNCTRAIKELLTMGPQTVVITMGSRGVVYNDGHEICRHDAMTGRVKDTTGAGDVFHGAFLYGCTQNWDIHRKVQFAATGAFLSCQVIGGQSALPTRQKIMSMLTESDAKT